MSKSDNDRKTELNQEWQKRNDTMQRIEKRSKSRDLLIDVMTSVNQNEYQEGEC